MNSYNIPCPGCGKLLYHCSDFVKCSNCKAKIKITYNHIVCPKCHRDKIITCIEDNNKFVYCFHCKHMIKESHLISKNILEERLKFKTVIPKNYWEDLQIDLYEFEIGEIKDEGKR